MKLFQKKNKDTQVAIDPASPDGDHGVETTFRQEEDGSITALDQKVIARNTHADASSEDLLMELFESIYVYMKPMNEKKFTRREHSFEKMIEYYEMRISQFDEEEPANALRTAFSMNLKACQMARSRLIQHQRISNDIRSLLSEIERRHHGEED